MDHSTMKLVNALAKRRDIERRICTIDEPMPANGNPKAYTHLDTFETGEKYVCQGCGYEMRRGLRVYEPELAETC